MPQFFDVPMAQRIAAIPADGARMISASPWCHVNREEWFLTGLRGLKVDMV
jgi:hypothetical protein